MFNRSAAFKQFKSFRHFAPFNALRRFNRWAQFQVEGPAWDSIILLRVSGSMPSFAKILPSLIPSLSGTTLSPFITPSGCWSSSSARSLPRLSKISQEHANPLPAHSRAGMFNIGEAEFSSLATDRLHHQLRLCTLRRSGLPDPFLELFVGGFKNKKKIIHVRPGIVLSLMPA